PGRPARRARTGEGAADGDRPRRDGDGIRQLGSRRPDGPVSGPARMAGRAIGHTRGDVMSGELDGRTIIVTGASRGIGKALAVGLAARGAAVVCAARTVTADPAGLPGTIHATVAAIEQAGGRALAVRCDVGRADDLRALVARTLEQLGRV